jgi:AraC-like DNA-binding protein
MAGVQAWERAGILFEHYTYDPGPRGVMPVHSHEHYQWCLSVDFPGFYDYRGARHPVPPTAVSVIHPGEPHASGDPIDREAPATFLLANIPPDVAEDLVAEVAARRQGGRPYFTPVSVDREVRRRFLDLHRASTVRADRLAFDAALLRLAAYTLPTMAGTGVDEPRPAGSERRAVEAARAYLHERASTPVSLAELAGVARLSQRHLFRTFKAETGITPHRYQLQLRIDRAKARLATGERPAAVAEACGFADQSHLARQFRRYVGFPPGRYRPR